MALFLGIDLGTSYFKVGLFDETGALKGLGRVPVNKTTPAPGRCELAVDELWRALRHGLVEALRQADAYPSAIAAMSYSSQASTFLLLDAKDEPLTPLIVWIDARAGAVPEDLAALAASSGFRNVVGFTGLAEQSAPVKWRWYQQHAPAEWARARKVLTISDYFTYALTGELTGDASTVAFLGAYDLRRNAWWPEALRAYGVSPAMLSTPRQPGTSVGRTSARAAALLGVPAGIPFAVGALDHHAAAIGSGLERLADASISTGTVLAALALVGAPTPAPGCFHGRHVDGVRFWRLAFDSNGAAQLEDYQRRMAPKLAIEDLLAAASAAPAGAAWRTEADGHGERVRAILENVAVTHYRLLGSVAAGGGMEPIRSVVATGGGARSPLWLQITADVLEIPVVTPACPERACLGAAAFAAVAAGAYDSLTAATTAMVRPERIYEPEPRAAGQYRRWMKAPANR